MKFKKLERNYRNVVFTKYAGSVAYFISFVALIPCIFIFVEMMKEDMFKKKAESFVADISKTDYSVVGKNYQYRKDTPVVELTFIGSVSDHPAFNTLSNHLQKYVSPSKLILHYTNARRNINEQDLETLISRINRQDSIINNLQTRR